MKIVTWIFHDNSFNARDIRKYRSSCLEYFKRRVLTFLFKMTGKIKISEDENFVKSLDWKWSRPRLFKRSERRTVPDSIFSEAWGEAWIPFANHPSSLRCKPLFSPGCNFSIGADIRSTSVFVSSRVVHVPLSLTLPSFLPSFVPPGRWYCRSNRGRCSTIGNRRTTQIPSFLLFFWNRSSIECYLISSSLFISYFTLFTIHLLFVDDIILYISIKYIDG